MAKSIDKKIKRLYVMIHVPDKEVQQEIRKWLKHLSGEEDRPAWKILHEMALEDRKRRG